MGGEAARGRFPLGGGNDGEWGRHGGERGVGVAGNGGAGVAGNGGVGVAGREAGYSVGAVLGEIPLFGPGAGSAASAGMTVVGYG